jgi:hypothetical protein
VPALGNGEPSRVLFDCIGSLVLGTAPPLELYVPGATSFGLANPPEGVAVDPFAVSLVEPLAALRRFVVACFALDAPWSDDIAEVPLVPPFVLCADAAAAAHTIATQASPAKVLWVIDSSQDCTCESTGNACAAHVERCEIRAVIGWWRGCRPQPWLSHDRAP